MGKKEWLSNVITIPKRCEKRLSRSNQITTYYNADQGKKKGGEGKGRERDENLLNKAI